MSAETNQSRANTPTMERITIRITPRTLETIDAAVEAGVYPSRSEAVRDALRDHLENLPAAAGRDPKTRLYSSEKITIRVPTPQRRHADSHVDSGCYPNRSVLVRCALVAHLDVDLPQEVAR